MFELYIRESPKCTYCELAKEALNKNNLPYDIHVVGRDLTVSELKEKFPSATTYPIILYDGKGIGGYTELKSMILSLKLEGN